MTLLCYRSPFMARRRHQSHKSLPTCRSPFTLSPLGADRRYYPRYRRRRNKRSPPRPRRRCSRLALPLIRPIPQRCPLTLNPSTSALAMAAIVSTSCADAMPCGNASIVRGGNGLPRAVRLYRRPAVKMQPMPICPGRAIRAVQVLQTVSVHHARYGGTEHGDIGRANSGAARAPAQRISEIDD